MQVLGQDVEVGDLIVFPINRRKGQTVLARVSHISSGTAHDGSGNSRPLPHDDHVTVVTRPNPRWKD